MNEYKPFVLFITGREMKGCGELEEHQNQSPVGSRAEKKTLRWKYGVLAESLRAAPFLSTVWREPGKEISKCYLVCTNSSSLTKPHQYRGSCRFPDLSQLELCGGGKAEVKSQSWLGLIFTSF